MPNHQAIRVPPTALSFRSARSAPDRVTFWTKRISAAWRESVEGIIKVGKLLIEACEELDEAKAGKLLGREPHPQRLPFGYRTAYRLMKIARDERLVTHVSQLPPSWSMMHALATLTNEQFADVSAAGLIKHWSAVRSKRTSN